MNSFIVKMFIRLTEVLSGVIIGLIVLVGMIMTIQGNFLAGIGVALFGTFFVVVFFGLSAIFIEMHKDIRAIKEISEKYKSQGNSA